MTVMSMIATEDARGERLDRVLARNFADFSRARLQALIREGAVRLGEAAATDPSLKLRGGETITLTVPQAKPSEPLGQKIPLTIVYEDARSDRHRQAGGPRRASRRRAMPTAHWSMR